jgi:hypothetical protein
LEDPGRPTDSMDKAARLFESEGVWPQKPGRFVDGPDGSGVVPRIEDRVVKLSVRVGNDTGSNLCESCSQVEPWGGE